MATNRNVYHAETTIRCCPDGKYVKSFRTILHKDSPNKAFGFKDEILRYECLDMDMMEVEKSGDNDKTMDLTIGIADFDDVRQKYSNCSLLPVELKLNCTSFTLKRGELVGKDSCTRNYGFDVRFSTTSVFLFTQDVVGLALSNFNRWKNGSGGAMVRNWVAMSPSQFNSFIHTSSEFPYKPITDFKQISDIIDRYIASKDIDGCFGYLSNDLRGKLEEFKYVNYNRYEIEHITSCLKSKIQEIYPVLTDFEKQYLQLAVDPLLNLAGGI